MSLDENAHAAFDGLMAGVRSGANCPTIDYRLPWPKWQFLCHVAENHAVVLHGSGNSEIARFEPRQPVDVTAFGSQKAVYAAADGLWAMYFAILDRDRHPMTLANACIRLSNEAEQVQGPYYVFSVSQLALLQKPWRMGTVYLLPEAGFRMQEPMVLESIKVQTAQLANLEAVEPLAKLTIAPEDFPFLANIRGHDDSRLEEYAAAMQHGLPWPQDTA